MKWEIKSTFVLCRRGLASILISSKRHARCTALKLKTHFLQVIFLKVNEYNNMLRLNCSSHETTGEVAWVVQIRLMVCGTNDGFVWNMQSRLTICRSCESFAWNIGNHLAVKESCEEIVSNIQNHLKIFKTRYYSSLNIQIHLTFRGTLEDFVHSM